MDPSWPERPPNLPWGDVPGIAVDRQDQIWIFTRTNPPVQVFSAEGRVVRAWGQGIVSNAHHLKVPWGFWITDRDEIWVCGSSPMPWRRDPNYPTAPLGCPPKDQVFMKFNPEGKLLQLWTVPKAQDGHEQPGECNWLHAVAVDSRGNIYAGDIIGKRAQKFVRKL